MGEINLIELEKALDMIGSSKDTSVPRKVFLELQEKYPTRPIAQKEIKEKIKKDHPEFLEGLDTRGISNSIRRALQGMTGVYYKKPALYFKPTEKLVEVASEKVGKPLTFEQVKKMVTKELEQKGFILLKGN